MNREMLVFLFIFYCIVGIISMHCLQTSDYSPAFDFYLPLLGVALVSLFVFYNIAEALWPNRNNVRVKAILLLIVCFVTTIFVFLGIASLGEWGLFIARYLAIGGGIAFLTIFFLMAHGLFIEKIALFVVAIARLVIAFTRNTMLAINLARTRSALAEMTKKHEMACERFEIFTQRYTRLFGEPNVASCCENCFLQSSKFADVIRAATCAVCLDDVVPLAALVPCGHVIMCNECASSMQHCPYCRSPIFQAIAIYDVAERAPPKEETPPAFVEEEEEEEQAQCAVERKDDNSEKKTRLGRTKERILRRRKK
jgi:hypothetical protein